MFKKLFVTLPLVTILFALQVSAQTPPTAPKFFDIEAAHQRADSELKRVTQLRNAERKKIDGFNPCEFNRLTAEMKSHEWFTQNSVQIQKMYQDLNLNISEINQKIEELSQFSIKVNPVNISQPGEMEIRLEKLIEYFRIYNGRMKNSKKELLPEIKRQFEENPESNELNLIHSQILVATEIMSKNLNASLKEPEYEFTILAKKVSNQFIDLVLKITLNQEQFEFSLLDSAQGQKVQFQEALHWKLISNQKINEVPVDSALRFHYYLKQQRGTCIAAEYPLFRKFNSNVPFTLFSDYQKSAANYKDYKIEMADLVGTWKVELGHIGSDHIGTMIISESGIARLDWGTSGPCTVTLDRDNNSFIIENSILVFKWVSEVEKYQYRNEGYATKVE